MGIDTTSRPRPPPLHHGHGDHVAPRGPEPIDAGECASASLRRRSPASRPSRGHGVTAVTPSVAAPAEGSPREGPSERPPASGRIGVSPGSRRLASRTFGVAANFRSGSTSRAARRDVHDDGRRPVGRRDRRHGAGRPAAARRPLRWRPWLLLAIAQWIAALLGTLLAGKPAVMTTCSPAASSCAAPIDGGDSGYLRARRGC